MLEGAHVVEPVGELHDDHASVPRHREQQLPVALDLSLGVRPDLDPGDLGQRIYDSRDLVAEFLPDLLDRRSAVLHHVVKERRRDAHRVRVDLGQDRGDGDTVRDVVLAGASLLSFVPDGAELKGQREKVEVQPVLVAPDRGEKLRRQCARVGVRCGDGQLLVRPELGGIR